MKFQLKNLPWLLTASTFAFVALAHSQTTKPNSQDNLQKLGVALLQYSDDYDGKLPPMQTATQAKEALLPYVDNDKNVFIQPGTSKSYLPNPYLSGQMHARFNNRKIRAIAFAEPIAALDKSRAVLFLPFFDPKIVHYPNNSGFVKNDVKRLTQTQWLKTKSVKR